MHASRSATVNSGFVQLLQNSLCLLGLPFAPLIWVTFPQLNLDLLIHTNKGEQQFAESDPSMDPVGGEVEADGRLQY